MSDAVADLEREFDFIFLGVGLGAMHKLDIPGGDHRGVVDALEYIAAYKTGEPRNDAKSVAVIGAGNTAIDAAVAAKRLGAAAVKILYRRDEKSISAFDFEFDHAIARGCGISLVHVADWREHCRGRNTGVAYVRADGVE